MKNDILMGNEKLTGTVVLEMLMSVMSTGPYFCN